MQLNPAKTLYAKLQAWIHEQFSQPEPDIVHLQGQYISRYVSMPLNKNLKSKEMGETLFNYIIGVIICSSGRLWGCSLVMIIKQDCFYICNHS